MSTQGNHPDTTDAFDMSVLHDMCPTPEDVHIFLGMLVGDITRHLRELKGALEGDDWITAGRSAHSLGSAAAFVGAPSTSTLARELEHRIKGGDTTALADLHAEVDARGERLVGAINTWLHTHSTQGSGPGTEPTSAPRR